jgi:hypothetical protein
LKIIQIKTKKLFGHALGAIGKPLVNKIYMEVQEILNFE